MTIKYFILVGIVNGSLVSFKAFKLKYFNSPAAAMPQPVYRTGFDFPALLGTQVSYKILFSR